MKFQIFYNFIFFLISKAFKKNHKWIFRITEKFLNIVYEQKQNHENEKESIVKQIIDIILKFNVFNILKRNASLIIKGN